MSEPVVTPIAKDDLGNAFVDFVYGGRPIQPNEGRETPLDPELDGHKVVTDGYNGYPENTPGAVEAGPLLESKSHLG